MMFILETMFMLLAVAVALFDDERGLTPLLLSSGIMDRDKRWNRIK